MSWNKSALINFIQSDDLAFTQASIAAKRIFFFFLYMTCNSSRHFIVFRLFLNFILNRVWIGCVVPAIRLANNAAGFYIRHRHGFFGFFVFFRHFIWKFFRFSFCVLSYFDSQSQFVKLQLYTYEFAEEFPICAAPNVSLQHSRHAFILHNLLVGCRLFRSWHNMTCAMPHMELLKR